MFSATDKTVHHADVLGNVRDSCGQSFTGGDAREAVAIYLQGAAVRLVQSHEHTNECRFAGPVFSYETMHLALVDVEVHIR